MAKKALRFESDYLLAEGAASAGLPGHRVTLTLTPSSPVNRGTLYLDPNSCALDAFGDPTMCTLMLGPNLDLKLTLVEEEHRRRLYDIEARYHGPLPPGHGAYGGPPLRLVLIQEPALLPDLKAHLRARLLVLREDKSIARIIALHPMAASLALPYETRPDLVVLSADVAPGFVPPSIRMNHVALTRVYGDGRVVFVDPEVSGVKEIREGRLTAEQISQLFDVLDSEGFWSFEDSYHAPHTPTDQASTVIAARHRGEAEKRVASYMGAVSAPPGFMDCFKALTFPQLQPSEVHIYKRQPISEAELQAGWYFGMEYQKKLNTPEDWVWVSAGRSSKWQRPPA